MEAFFDDLTAVVKDGAINDAVHREISLKYGIEWLE